MLDDTGEQAGGRECNPGIEGKLHFSDRGLENFEYFSWVMLLFHAQKRSSPLSLLQIISSTPMVDNLQVQAGLLP